MTQADNSVVFDETGAVCANSCTNCPFLTPHMGEHCVLRPEVDMSPLWKDRTYLPDACPLRPAGLEVRLDFNRDELLMEGKRFPEWPLGESTVVTIMVPPSRFPPSICKAKGLRKSVSCLYDEDAETGNGESDHCVRCHVQR